MSAERLTYTIVYTGISLALAASCAAKKKGAPEDAGGVASSSAAGATGGGGGGTPDTCGDGELQADEECDDMGESATCDVDCTMMECGDGVANTTAGEVCDDAGDSMMCNADCTAAVCGDGYTNTAAGEECDDGGVNDQDGCSAKCEIEGTCTMPLDLGLADLGNGILEAHIMAATSGKGTVGAADCDGQMMLGAGPDRVYSFQVTEPSNINLDAFGKGWDLIMRLQSDPCDPKSEIPEKMNEDGCTDYGDVGAKENLAYSNLMPGTYYVVIDGATELEEGEYTLDAQLFTTVFDCNDSLMKGNSTSGVLTMDPDGAGGEAPFDAYCDMTSDGGGWTLIARFSNADTDEWMLDSGEWWYDKTSESGAPTDPTQNADMFSKSFFTVKASELKISRTDDATNAGILITNTMCLGGKHFREYITGFGDFKNGAVWGMDSVAATCPATLAGNYASTLGFTQANCAGTIGAASAISFWADWSAGDGAVMMIGGGGNSCNRADHGIGVTEANAASFVYTASGEGDFGNDGGQTTNPAYALNLWVR